MRSLRPALLFSVSLSACAGRVHFDDLAVASTEKLAIGWDDDVLTVLAENVGAGRTGFAVLSKHGFEPRLTCTANVHWSYLGLTPSLGQPEFRSTDALYQRVLRADESAAAHLGAGGAITVEHTAAGQWGVPGLPAPNPTNPACAGVTHVVIGLHLGAMRADGASGAYVVPTRGDFSACGAAGPDSAEPPPGCAAPVAVVLAPLPAKQKKKKRRDDSDPDEELGL